MTHDEAINDFLTAVDAKLQDNAYDHIRYHALSLPPVARLKWHLEGARGSLDWFSQGQKAAERLGQPPSDTYARAIESATAFIRAGEALLLEGAP